MHDVIIIGSGFGGSVSACRLAEAGKDVVLLERGRRWDPEEYPRGLDDAWIYDIDEPEKQNGWIDIRFMDDMWVAQGAGVGGGSLIYANVVIDANPEMFDSGWPSQISYQGLKKYYDIVAQMMQLEPIPDNQLTPRFELMRDAAEATGAADRFRKVDLAISFDPDGKYPDSRPEIEEPARTFINPHGREQGYCIHAGNCDIGCKVKAKNTLDLNYLAVAEDNGADIRPLSMVSHIAQEGDNYVVVYHDLRDNKKVERVIRAKKVILAAGSLSSTEILFRSRDKYRTLPDISASLGHNWTSNGDFLTPAFYDDRELSPSIGPTITSAIDFLDGKEDGARYFVEDGGFPSLLTNIIKDKNRSRFSPGNRFIKALLSVYDDGDPLENMMPWFGQAMDGGDGRLYYGRDWLRPWKKRLKLDWDAKRSERGIGGLINAHLRLSKATGGRATVPPTWKVFRNLVTPHPLGGCSMASSPAAGVVDHTGQVFSYPGLYVIDGSVFPRPIGLNPSKTIAALAERSIALMLEE